MNKPQRIIIHHSFTEDNFTLSSFNAIRRYHMEDKGWKDIAYHYVLEYVAGKVVTRPGRAESVEGAHTAGYNSTSIGICIVGNFDEDTPTEDMYKAVADLCKSIRRRHGNIPIEPHNKYAKKTCPGKNFDMLKLTDAISKPVAALNPTKYGVVTATTLNVRENRTTQSKIIGKLKKGEKIKLDRQMGDWWCIYYGAHGGFVHKDYIKLV